MIKLREKFVSGEGGFSTDPLTYTQLARTDKVAIYERSRDGKVKDYEVFKIKILPKGTQVFQTTTVDDEEKYPGTSQFGFIAWSFCNKGAAMARYNELCNPTAPVVIPDADPVEDQSVTIPIVRSSPVAKLNIPPGEFSVKDLAAFNSVEYITGSLFVKDAVATGVLQFVRKEKRNVGRGKPTNIYTLKSSN